MALGDFATKRMVEIHGSVPPVRFGSQFVLDAMAWVVALVIAETLRYEFAVGLIAFVPLILVCAAAVLAQLAFGWGYHLYRGRYTYGSFSEVRGLLWAVLWVAAVIGVPVAVFGVSFGIPRSTMFIALPLAFVMMAGVRYTKRLLVERSIRPGESAQRTLIFGAGYLGDALTRRMLLDPYSVYRPVGIVDDDPGKQNLRLYDVPVLGDRSRLGGILEQTGATVLVVSVAKADATLLRELTDVASQHDVVVKVFPLLEEVLAGRQNLKDLRNVKIEDLIGRHPVDTQVESIAGYLASKRVLVTGAGGSIGSELCRQISKYGPQELIMLDHDETGLQSAQLGTSGHGLLDTRDVVLADIRDVKALVGIFEERRPDVVFHAAALKHLPMLEQYPDEAWKTNVIGTLNVLNAARGVGVDTFVNISTDKAANPTSALGHSKRAAEKLTAWAAGETGSHYLSVRFGNVIGSRGSMFPTFTALIESGGPLTVTHPDATRFFMTIPEACQLVVQAGGIGAPGEVLTLDMGEPIRILDVAERMIAASGKQIELVFTGLRDGEKLHEELMGDGETNERLFHPKVSHSTVPSLNPSELRFENWIAKIHAAGSASGLNSVVK
ncbi:polysaccharide biosynthesis protein [Luethyella okanaganae]|uniref:Polysaccharide biosynthesis protein n=1 Tax=Luethyella okanaganae TaxID=69372 RepID=A0ABW1V9E5_9MICO